MTGPVIFHVWLTAAIELAAGLGAALVTRFALRRLARRTEQRVNPLADHPSGTGRWRAEDLILSLLRTVIPGGLALAGLWSAVLILPLTAAWRTDSDHVLLAVAVLITTMALARVTARAVRDGALSHAGTSGSATIFVNITRVMVVMIGLLIVLDSLGVAITPLLTALGVGGLAVALALQDTLTNLFAGVHILASGKVQPGDFIQLAGGSTTAPMEGYVVDTNWRNTTIRQLSDNLLIVPNSTVAASVITNFNRPHQEMSVLVQVGVAYDSDLDQVERVTIEVAREVMRAIEGGVPEHQPFIRYHTFDQSSIDFSVILRTTEVSAQYLVVHEFIKRLQRRYQKEGIQIPFPVRTIVQAPSAIQER